ncbi:MAG TPA: long-chain fatty acid--CoA ligase [Blastocatellia bacterium]
MQSTMQEWPLTITGIFNHGRQVHGESRVVTRAGGAYRLATYADLSARTCQLAGALKRLGVAPGDRVGTFCWNNQEHMEAYLAVPSMGAVLHTLNIRLFTDQLAYVINHAEDKVILVDDSLVPLLAQVAPALKSVQHFVVIGDGDASGLPHHLRYNHLLQAEPPDYDWPVIDECSAAAMCYTSGTTGNPKGVVYSHRSTVLHSMAVCTGGVFGISERDRILLIVPMFHANAWGMPYSGWMAGADLIMPGPSLQAQALCEMIQDQRPTFSGAVPTIWNELLRYAETHPVDFSSLRAVSSGGSAVPRSLMEKFKERHGLNIVQAWGMTETSPLAAVAHPPKDCWPGNEMEWKAKSGRVTAGVELRLVDGETVLPWDGKSVGEIEVRGPWITGAYYKEDSSEKFHDGWLRTGDVGTVDPKGFIQITDRAKDVIKSGGEWISTVELESSIMAHPDVIEAAVVGVADARWDERPLACVVLREGSKCTFEELRDFLGDRVAKWWIPERWAILESVPKTSVGKFDKKGLRAKLADGVIEICIATK